MGRVVRPTDDPHRRHGLAVAESAGVVTMLVGDDERRVPTAVFDRSEQVDLAAPPVFGEAGRLWSALRAQQEGRLQESWPAEEIERHAAVLARQGLGASRSAALDALGLDRPELLVGLDLSSAELHWYGAWVATAAGSVDELLDHLETLPPEGYPDRVGLLLRHFDELLSDPHRRARACTQLTSINTPEARALTDTLDDRPDRIVETMVSYAQGFSRTDLRQVASAISAVAPVGTLPPLSVPHLRALDAYGAGLLGYPLDSSVGVLGPLPEPLLDELVDTGALRHVPASTPWSPALTAYLRCRTDPGGTCLEDLDLGGFTAELARRYYLSGDLAELAALDGSDPAVAHYRALADARAGGCLDDVRLRPEARTVLAAVREVLDSTGDVEVPDEVAGDPSCWALIRPATGRDRLRLGEATRVRFPDFGAWLDLGAVQQLAFEGRWREVQDRGRELARTTGVEAIADEAQNMVAFAEWQSGDPGEALRVLDAALAGQFTTGLMVNAALLAAEQGSAAALGYLTQVIEHTDDPQVRRGALSRAVALWLGDRDSPDYPPVLADLVRRALTEPQDDDEFHRQLVRLSSRFDGTWFGAGRIAVAGAAQGAATRYHRGRTRWRTDPSPATLTGWTRALVTLWTALSPRPAWVVGERDDVSRQLMDMVHVPFGEAADTEPAIRVLVDATHVLPLHERLVLGVQAGAHLARSESKKGNLLDGDTERKLLFGPVAEYHRRSAELVPESVRENTGEELSRCLAVAGLSAADVASDHLDTFLDRERSAPSPSSVAKEERDRRLTDAEELVGRCRAYLTGLTSLPLSDITRDRRDVIERRTTDWAAELRRLRSSS